MSHLLFLLAITLQCAIPNQTVTAITQDSLGCMWLGGEDGLQRYDGYSLQQYLTTQHVPYYGYINRIYPADAEGTFYLCTTDGFYTYDYIHNQLSSPVADLMHRHITSYRQLSNSHRFVTTLSGAFIYNSNWSLIAHIHPHSDYVNTVFEDHAHRVWIGTDRGLELLGTASTGYSTKLIYRGRVRVIYEDKRGWLFFNKDMQVYGVPIERLVQGDISEVRLLNDHVDVVTAQVFHNELWMGTRGQGILRYDLDTPQPSAAKRLYIEDESTDVHNSILTFYQDRDSLIWIGTLDGLYFVQPSTQGFTVITQASSHLPSNTISSLYVDTAHQEETLWIGTYEGLCQRTSDGQIQTYPDYSSAAEIGEYNRIQLVTRCDEDRLLISTKSQLKYFNLRTHQYEISHSLNSICREYGLRYPRAHYVDKDGNIWIAFNEGGVAVYTRQDQQLHPLVWRDYRKDVHRAILRDSSGALWVSADQEGLYRLTLSKDGSEVADATLVPRELLNNQCVTSLLVAHDGTIYIGTFNGLFTLQDSLVPTPYPLSPATHNYISSLQQTPNGDIWASTTRCFYRLAPQSSHLSAIAYNLSINQDISKLWYIIGATATDTHIYWGGTSGLIICAPTQLSEQQKENTHRSASPMISRLLINNESTPFIPEDINYIHDVVHLGPDQRQIGFEFAAPEYVQAGGIYYAYQLEPIDKGFIQTSSQRRYTSYCNLHYGNYIFRVRSTDEHGNWLPNERVVRFCIDRPWYLTWWAITLWVIAAIGLGFTFIKMALHIRRLYLKQRELQTRITHLAVTPQQVSVLSDDDAFLKAMKEIVEQNISNDTFSVEQLASSLHMSTSQLYRRMVNLTELAPLEYIRTVRLNRAAQLLQTQRYRVFEVCTMVGFTDQRYFSNCFKRAYGVNPKAYSKMNNNTSDN